MKMSKALVWAVSVALTFSLVGCGPKQTAPVFQGAVLSPNAMIP